MDGIKSDKLIIQRGVLQGSIMGPLFYIIFVSDINKFCNTPNKMLLYAVDPTFVMSNKQFNALVGESNMATGELNNYSHPFLEIHRKSIRS